MELASFSIGDTITEQEALMALGDRVKILDNQHWWLTGFVSFQYGELKSNSNPHIAVSKRLSTLGLPLGNHSPTLPRRVQDQVQDQEGQPLAENRLQNLQPWQLNMDIDRVKRLLADEQDRRNSNPDLCRSYYADLEALKAEKRRRAPPRKPVPKPVPKLEHRNGNVVTPKSLEELAKLKQSVK